MEGRAGKVSPNDEICEVLRSGGRSRGWLPGIDVVAAIASRADNLRGGSEYAASRGPFGRSYRCDVTMKIELSPTGASDQASQVVLITGSTGSLGRAAAGRFAREGARLALVGREQARLDELAASLGVREDRVMTVVGELTDSEATRAIALAVTERWGRIDVLLHLVGGFTPGSAVVDLDPADVRGMLDQHVLSTLYVVQAVVPGMVERGFGRILSVSSPFATDVRAKSASYAIAKSSEEVLLRTLAREVAGSGVTANLVIVRMIDAKHERQTDPSTKNAAWTTPEEIADTFAFLCSPAAAAINGARIPLDGRG
jgi:NAD(P)-dependent dehydrogenase (short-subunit alcohol dehydrogenase family)